MHNLVSRHFGPRTLRTQDISAPSFLFSVFSRSNLQICPPLQIRPTRLIVSIKQGCILGLDVSVSSHINQRLVSRKIVIISVSGGRLFGLGRLRLVSKPIFGQIVQATVRTVNGLQTL